MKNNKINRIGYLGRLALTALAGFMIFFSSCKDDTVGLPVITKIRITNPAEKDSTFTQSVPGMMVVIQGENLGGLQKIYFNGYEAPFNPTLATDNNVIVTIPAAAPTKATNPNASNKIRLVTNHGETSFSYTLLPQLPVIYAISDELPNAGETVVINGDNFYVVTSLVLPGNVSVKDFTVSTDAKTITFKMPADITTGGSIAITAMGGVGLSTPTFNFMGNILSDFDTVNKYGGWGIGGLVFGDSRFPGAHGNYVVFQFSDVNAGDTSWWDGKRALLLGAAQAVPAAKINDPIDNYAIKFEIYVSTPWQTGNLNLNNASSYSYAYRPWIVNGKRTPFTTTGWTTVTVPFSSFKKSDGTAATKLTDVMNSDGTLALNIYYYNDPTNATSPETQGIHMDNFAAAVDNIRVVKMVK